MPRRSGTSTVGSSMSNASSYWTCALSRASRTASALSSCTAAANSELTRAASWAPAVVGARALGMWTQVRPLLRRIPSRAHVEEPTSVARDGGIGAHGECFERLVPRAIPWNPLAEQAREGRLAARRHVEEQLQLGLVNETA